MPRRPPEPERALRLALGARIRDLRVAAELTQERLGEMSDTDRKTIVRLEGGQIDPPLSFLFRISIALTVEVADLFHP